MVKLWPFPTFEQTGLADSMVGAITKVTKFQLDEEPNEGVIFNDGEAALVRVFAVFFEKTMTKWTKKNFVLTWN